MNRAIIATGLSLLLPIFVFGQDSATVEGVPDTIQAGERLTVVIKIDRPPNFDGASVRIYIQAPDVQIQSGCGIPQNQTTCTYQYVVPADATPGMWAISDLIFVTGLHEKQLPFTKVSFRVIGRSDLVIPTSVQASINPSQIQLFRREALRLQDRIARLKEEIKAEPSPLGLSTIRLLRKRVEEEAGVVRTTESQFKEMSDNSENAREAASIFFEDLRLSYSDVLTQLPEPSNVIAKTKSISFGTTKSAEQAKTVPLLAAGVLRAFEVNALAYSLAASSGSLMFNLEVNSNPAGATISYRRRGDSFKRHSSTTNCTLKSLPLAIWTVHFQLAGFKEQDVEFNPFVEPNRVVNANLTK